MGADDDIRFAFKEEKGAAKRKRGKRGQYPFLAKKV